MLVLVAAHSPAHLLPAAEQLLPCCSTTAALLQIKCCLLQSNCCLLQRVCVEALARLYHREAEDATALRQPTQTVQIARERAGKMWETLALAPAPPEEKALPIEQRRDWLRDARAEVGEGCVTPSEDLVVPQGAPLCIQQCRGRLHEQR